MGKSDWECYTGCDRISTTGLYYDFRVYCYWKSNGWRYNMGPVRGYACMDTEELVYNDSIDFQDNQGTYLLGYHDFRVNRGHSSIKKEYYAYIVSEASYESGTRESTPGEHLYCYTDAKTHTVITYNANGGSGQPGNQDKWYGESLYLSSTKPTRTGYTFKNWNTASNGSGTSYNPGSQYGQDPGGTVTLYAQWTPITYAVTYNGNGSNATNVPGSQTKTYGQNLTLSNQKPIRTDYVFNGWNTKADGTGTNYAAGATYTGNAALALYAKWTLAYVKPRYTNLSIARCNSSGTKSETGTYLRVDFGWATDLTGVYAKIQYKESTASSWTTASIFDNNSNKSGTVSNKVIGSNNFSIEKSYIARIYIYDSKGTSYATYSGEYAISTVAFPIDVRKQGKGVAFGKVAETDDLFDVNYNAQFRKNLVVHGERIERKLAIVGRTDNAGSNFWYKFASCTVNTVKGSDRNITFLVHSGYSDESECCGVLTAHFRTDGNGYFGNGRLKWEYYGSKIIPQNFVMAYTPRVASHTVELWCYVPGAWQQIHFDVLAVYDRGAGNLFDQWTVYKTVSQSGSTGPASSMTKIYSTSVITKSMITVGLTGRPAINGGNWTWARIPLNKVVSKCGDAFSLNNGIVKTDRTLRCLVSAQVTSFEPISEVGEWDIAIHETKSDTDIAVADGHTYHNLDHHTISPMFVQSFDSSMGIDLRYCTGYSGAWKILGDNINTYLTIQEV